MANRSGGRDCGEPVREKIMGFDQNRAREVHFDRMQRALEEGLKDINGAKTPEEADAARQRAQARLEKLNQMFEDAFHDRD